MQWVDGVEIPLISKSELDSHANMVVLGKECFVFEPTGKTCSVEPFSSELGIAQNVPIVDAALAYDCPFTYETYILIIRNALHIETMQHNLIPPFIMREGGVQVNDIPKMHCTDPDIDDHCISFKDTELRIPLQLKGIFSYFNTRKPLPSELYDKDKVFITPDASEWNPHCMSYAQNELAMTNHEGEIVTSSNHEKIPMQYSNDHDEIFELASVKTSDYETAVDAAISSCYKAEPQDVSRYDTDADFASRLNSKVEKSKFGATIGSTTSSHEDCCLFIGQAPSTMTSEELKKSLSSMLDETQINAVIKAVSAHQAKGASAKQLSKLWLINDELAQGALDQNTQLARHSSDNILSRQISTNDRMLRYKRIQSAFFTDTMFAQPNAKSLRQNTCCQVFVSDKGYVAVYPMKSQSEFKTALHWFCKQVGVPADLIVDGHKAQRSKDVRRFCNQVGTTLKILETGTPWANRAELYIGLLKEAVRKDMRASNSPMCLWDYAIERRAMIHNLVPRPLFQNKGLTPHAATFGESGDISNICTFAYYEWVYYRDHGSFPENKEKLGRVLGPLRNEGNEMAQAVVTSKATVVPRRTMRKLTSSELHNDSEKAKRKQIDEKIKARLGDSMSFPPKLKAPDFIPYHDDVEPDPLHIPDNNDPVDVNGIPLYEKPITDYWINNEVCLPQGEKNTHAKVIGRSKDADGNVIGTYDDNPFLNTMVYEVEFPDGVIKEYAANIIAENMYAQVDPSGHSTGILDSILDFKKDNKALSGDDLYVTTKSGRRRIRETTSGWKFLIQYKDGSETWMTLKRLKESNPLELAEFATARGIAEEPAFCWWVPYTLRRRDRIIATVNKRIKKISHKYGVEVPTSIEHAYKIDRANKNTLWRDAINKEMGNLKVAFDILCKGQAPPPGYNKASGHLVFDVRMTLERKARWVKDGHRTPEPEQSTFAGVVSRESIRIALTYAALNGLAVYGADIQNAYLQAPTSEKHYIICGPEFGLENTGKLAVIVRALYGGKSAGADYWKHVREAMLDMNFKSCKADPDVWFRPGTKPDGTTYYQYILLYTDDILCIMENPKEFLLNEFGKRFKLKETSIAPPTQYLGNKVSQVTLENGTKCWSFSSSQYIQNAVKNVEKHLANKDEKLPSRVKSPWSTGYRPETDISPELTASDAAYFQSLIGVLRWIVELNRIDITMETSAMASMMALPREGHLTQLYHMFSFLKSKHNAVMVFDPSEPDINESLFTDEDWTATAYGECKEELPSNAPEPRGLGFTMRAFVDSDHAGDCITRRSRTGYLIFLNSAPIYWFSKKQTSIETSSFGAEFIAMKLCCEYIRGLRYKLRMMGIPVDLPSYVFGDNQSVLSNTSLPHSKLKKKSSSITFHFVRECVAKTEWKTTYLNTHLNPSDMLTKSLPGGEKRTRFTSFVLHYITD